MPGKLKSFFRRGNLDQSEIPWLPKPQFLIFLSGRHTIHIKFLSVYLSFRLSLASPYCRFGWNILTVITHETWNSQRESCWRHIKCPNKRRQTDFTWWSLYKVLVFNHHIALRLSASQHVYLDSNIAFIGISTFKSGISNGFCKKRGWAAADTFYQYIIQHVGYSVFSTFPC